MNTTIKVADLERWTRIAEDTRKEIAFNKATGTWTWNNRGDLADHGPFKTYAEALYDAIEPYVNEDYEEAPAKVEPTSIKDQVRKAVDEYKHALFEIGPSRQDQEKMLFDALYIRLERLMGPGHFDTEGLATSIVDKLARRTGHGNLLWLYPEIGDMITFLQIAQIALDRDDVRDQLVEEMTLSDDEVTRLVKALNRHIGLDA